MWNDPGGDDIAEHWFSPEVLLRDLWNWFKRP